MVGGGVRGKDIGIAHGTTTQVGTTIEAFHLFIEGYPHTGEMTTGIIVGEGIGGTTNEYLTTKLNKTGEAGKRVSIGRINKRGVSKVCDTERDHNNRLEGCNNREPMKEGKFNSTRRQAHNPERSNQSVHNNNTGMQVHNPERDNLRTHSDNRETMTKKKENNKTGRKNNSTQSNNREAMKAGEGSSKNDTK